MITRLQDYLRHSATSSYHAQTLSPFTLFFHPHDTLRYFNYAIPDRPIRATESLGAVLDSLKQAFRTAERLPRFEWLQEYSPALADHLLAAGFTCEAENPLLLCSPDDLTFPSTPDGITLSRLTPSSSVADFDSTHEVAGIAFGMPMAADDPNRLGNAQRTQESAAERGIFVARARDTIVATGQFSAPHNGMTEIAGVATLPEYRQRGIAGALTAYATAAAFADGCTLAFLSAGDEGAARVYERAGYRRLATALAYVVESAEESAT